MNGRLVIVPVVDSGCDLAALLGQVAPDNLHAEVDFGAAAGGEVW